MPDISININVQVKVTDLVRLLKGVQGLRSEIDHIQKHGPNKQFNKWLNMPVAEFEFSPRVENVLKSNGCRYIGNLVQRSEHEMTRWANFGKLSLKELKDRLGTVGLHLEMPPSSYEGWSPPDGRNC